MITKDLEAKLITALTSATASISAAHQLVGSWQPSAVEAAATTAVVAVALGTPDMPTYTAPTVTFNGSISIIVRDELDRDRATFVAIADAIVSLFKTWQGQTYQQAFTALDLTGLSIDEVSMTGSQPPVLAAPNITLSIPFTLSGHYTS